MKGPESGQDQQRDVLSGQSGGRRTNWRSWPTSDPGRLNGFGFGQPVPPATGEREPAKAPRAGGTVRLCLGAPRLPSRTRETLPDCLCSGGGAAALPVPPVPAPVGSSKRLRARPDGVDRVDNQLRIPGLQTISRFSSTGSPVSSLSRLWSKSQCIMVYSRERLASGTPLLGAV